MSNNSTALAVRETSTAVAQVEAPRLGLLRPIAAPSEIIAAQNAAREMVHQALKPGRDYGVIPGTGDKPTMLKPGAERVALGFGCYYGTPEILEQEIDHDREVRWSKRGKSGTSYGLYRYVVKVPVIERASGSVVGSGVGACSSMESKYVERPRDVENTILKMAHKRAVVAACLLTFGLSDEFTQDVEDLAPRNAEERDGENAGVDRARPQAEDVETPLTIETALAMALPGAKTAWNGKGGTPLGELEPKMIPAIRKWINGKIETAEGENTDVQALYYRLRAACDLITEMRKADADKDQTKMDLESAAPADQTTTAPVDTKLAPGKVEDALAKPEPTMSSLAKEIARLLKHEKLSDAERKDFRDRAARVSSLGALQLIADELEDLITSPI